MFRRLAYWAKDYFGFSQTETTGFWVMIVLLLMLCLAPLVAYWLPDTPDLSLNEQQAEQLAAAIVLKQKAYPARERYDNDSPSDYTPFRSYEKSSSRLFVFDPNQASEAQLVELGFPKWMAERLIKYRNKGGQFRKKEDLLKLYNFPKELYFRLEPYIAVAQATDEQPLRTADAPKPPFETKYEAKGPPKTPTKFDLNAADTTELVKIKGIGSKLASRIVKFRDNLGGFYDENQLREVFGLDSTVVAETLKYAYVRSPQLRKIPINDVSVETFKHPYLKPYVARAIVAYRQQHGPFTSAKDLTNIKVLDAKTLERITPYLSF